MWDILGNTRSRLSAIVREELDNNSYTPDRPLLDQSVKVLVFEYGDLRKGFQHHRMMGDDTVNFVTYAVTHDRYFLWCARQGPASFPIASKIGGINAGRTRIRGELYRVYPDALVNIDKYRENGVKFTRKLVKIHIPSGEIMTVHAYVAIESYWKEMIQWDNQYYRGNGGSAYVPLNADQEDLQRPFFGRYTEFTDNHLKERNPQCYLHCTRDMIANARKEQLKGS